MTQHFKLISKQIKIKTPAGPYHDPRVCLSWYCPPYQ